MMRKHMKHIQISKDEYLVQNSTKIKVQHENIKRVLQLLQESVNHTHPCLLHVF